MFPKCHRDVDWLALTLRSESEQPHEWPALAWVIRNRTEARGFPISYYKVITAASQFSYFNKYRGVQDSNTLWLEATEGYAGDDDGLYDNDLVDAIRFSRYFVDLPLWDAPFGREVLYFWAPRSMVPIGSDPRWAKNLERVFQMDGMPRWKFGER